MTENREKKNNKLWIILLLVLLAAIALVYFFVIGNKVKVTFEPGNGENAVVVKIKKGTEIAEPVQPVWEGFKFIEWQKDGQPYDFSKPVNEDTTLVAEWVVLHNITFSSNGENYATQQVEHEKLIVLPENPTLEGYKFVGWLDNDDILDANKPVESDKVLNALFRLYKPIKTMKFDNKYRIGVGETCKPVLICTPDDWAENISYTSSNPAIATVDETGLVYGVSAGKVTITATSESGVTAQTEVNVEIYPTDFQLSFSSIDLKMNETAKLQVTKWIPNTATLKNVVYSSTNKSVATVDANGNIVPVGGGSCDINVVANNKISHSVTVNVTEYVLNVTVNGAKKGNIGKILYYNPANRPIAAVTAELVKIDKTGKTVQTVDMAKLLLHKNVSDDKVLYYNNSELYATGYGVKEYDFYGRDYSFNFEYTDPDGIVQKSNDFEVTVEPRLVVYCNGVVLDGQYHPAGEAWENVEFTFTVYMRNVTGKVTSGGAKILKETVSTPKPGMPVSKHFKMSFQKNNNGSTSTVKFTTPGGQVVEINIF